MPLWDLWLVSPLRVVLCVLGDVVGEGVRSLRPHPEDSLDMVVSWLVVARSFVRSRCLSGVRRWVSSARGLVGLLRMNLLCFDCRCLLWATSRLFSLATVQ
jgi:hypothetical protein